jgi:hypothetical protein
LKPDERICMRPSSSSSNRFDCSPLQTSYFSAKLKRHQNWIHSFVIKSIWYAHSHIFNGEPWLYQTLCLSEYVAIIALSLSNASSLNQKLRYMSYFIMNFNMSWNETIYIAKCYLENILIWVEFLPTLLFSNVRWCLFFSFFCTMTSVTVISPLVVWNLKNQFWFSLKLLEHQHRRFRFLH